MEMARRVVGLVAVPSIDLVGRQPRGSISQAEELEQQRGRIRDYARKRRWELEHIFEGLLEPGTWSRTIKRSDGLDAAMAAIEAGRASTLVVDRLERISFFTDDVFNVVRWHLEHSAGLVAFDDGLDTTRQGGMLILNAFVWGVDWERRMAGARLRAGRAYTKKWGRGLPEHAGRMTDRPGLLEYIHRLREEGLSLVAIAERLEQEGLPTSRGGGYWWPSTVASALRYPRPN